MSMWKVRLTSAIADANVASLAQHAMAFMCDGGRASKMMIGHRHEYEIGTAIPERKRLCHPLPVRHVSNRGLAASLI